MPTPVTTSLTSLGTQLSTQDLRMAEYQRQLHEYEVQVAGFTTYQLDVGVSMSEKSLEKKYSTTVTLDDGMRLTVSMNMADAARISTEQANSMFWRIPCEQEGNATLRTLARVQECKCLVCQTACATILKWRMMK